MLPFSLHSKNAMSETIGKWGFVQVIDELKGQSMCEKDQI
jgi:hypothetical protein